MCSLGVFSSVHPSSSGVGTSCKFTAGEALGVHLIVEFAGRMSLGCG